MQISDSNLLLSSWGSSFLSDRRNVELQLTAAQIPSFVANQNGNTSSVMLDMVEISSEALKAYSSSQEAVISGLSAVRSMDGDSTGLELIVTADAWTRTSAGASSQKKTVIVVSGGVLPQGWDVEFSSTAVHYESEQMRVAINGTVTTQDGREITFTLDLGLSREYTSIEQESAGAEAVTTDPLVINFRGGLPGLADTTFAFDINSDGSKELIYATASGSGFLSLDRNGDGSINNGSELFGPATGNGFSELAGYDGDHNGWIDENDKIFSKLSIWTRDEAGHDKLITLKEAGVGAMSLNSVASAFSITGDANQLKGQVQKTGIYLSEQGRVGAMQQIDLAVTPMAGEPRDEEETDAVGQAVESLRIRNVETLTNISRLAATASWLADKAGEIIRSFKDDLAHVRKGHGGFNENPESQAQSPIEQMIKYLDDSIKAHSLKSKEDKRIQ